MEAKIGAAGLFNPNEYLDNFVPGDVDGGGVFSLPSDRRVLQRSYGATPTGPNDPRDVNCDGRIDRLDMDALRRLRGR